MSQSHSSDNIAPVPVIQVDEAVKEVPSGSSEEPSAIDKMRLKMRPLLLYVVSLAQFLDIVNGTSVSVALIPIAENLNFEASQTLWIINAYTTAFAGFLLFSGRLGDLFGHRRLFMFGLFWFATWALVVSFSSSPVMLAIARALQGVSAASTVPTALALISTNYPAGPERTKAISIFGAFGGMGAVAGLLMSGGILAAAGWRWVFRVSSIVAYILLILGFLTIPIIPAKNEAVKIDYVGAITATLGVTGVVYYISIGVDYGWADSKTLPILIIGLVLIAAFIYTESKVQSALMPLRVWRNRAFSASTVLAFVSMAMAQGTMYNVNMVFQRIYRWNAIQTALGFLVHALLAVVVFATLGRVLSRLRLKPLVLIGFLLRCATGLMFAFVSERCSYWRLPFPALIIHIIGVGLTLLPIQVTVVRDADNRDQGLVGAIYNTSLQLGAPFGIAILNVVAISTTTNGYSIQSDSVDLMRGYRNAFFGIIALGLVGFVIALIFLPWDRSSRPSKESIQECEAVVDMEVDAAIATNTVKDAIINDSK
ncbi:hypothetical protein BGZ80_009367 [Entomortierella chlamydospora]|uniref:Major facilitator superfamily (MFS) profile domain-containing protein n=1 Tax=Entomortierella chlamydospora TaxID=101097 RepID=A0A9P6MWC5_9FUNG|nr:hypothetical protein BGZ79_000024 [Entomortierella chlamydospora]KAG0016206.1 hypothetical protein BGZ80_009367 [Entomortierella chlamydospora]